MPSRRDVLAAAAGSGLLAAVPTAGAADRSTGTPDGDDFGAPWPMYRGGAANTGAGPGAAPPTGSPSIAWRRDVGSVPAAPALVPGGVVVPGDVVTMLDADDGTERWRTKPSAPAYSQPVVARETVYLGHDDGVEALALNSGERRWLVRTDGAIRTVAVADGRVYADIENGPLLAVDADDGTERWRLGGGDGRTHPPTVAGDAVFVGGKQVLAVDAETGDALWEAPAPDAAQQLGTVAVGGGRVVGVGTVDAEDAVVAAYDAAEGTMLWSNTVPKAVNTAGGDPVVAGSEILTALGGLRSIDRTSGEQQWLRQFDTVQGATPAVTDGVAIVRADRESLRAVDLDDRSVLWSLPLDGPLSTAPVVGEGTAYVGDGSGTLYAVGSRETAVATPTEPGRTFGYGWVDSWAPVAGVLGAVHVLAPLVLGGLLGTADRLTGGRGDGDDD